MKEKERKREDESVCERGERVERGLQDEGQGGDESKWEKAK